MNSVAAPRLRITVTVYPKARGLALGLAMPAAPQLIARLTQVTLKNAVDYSSILLPFQRSSSIVCAKAVETAAGVASSENHRSEAAVRIKGQTAS